MRQNLKLFPGLSGKVTKPALLAMRMVIIISAFAWLNASAAVYSESNAISIQVENIKLRDLFREIENNSDYAFFFNDEFAELDKSVSLEISNENIEIILDRLLKDTNLDYQLMENNFIVIVPREAALQGKTVSGTVIDAEGNPLPGVNVVEQGTTNGVITDLDGNFSITVGSEASVLVFSYVGYLEESIAVGNQTSIDLTMVENIEALEEIVVVGYGSMERTNVTGAISTVDAKELEKAPVPNFVEAMRGQVPGVRITRTDGKPGEGVNFLIRGENSLNNSNDPLIVIDGVPSSGGNLAELNPADIESVNILKDAGAASIYGTRGANGVVLVTTKAGRVGKPVLNITLSQGFTDLVHKPELMNAEEFVQLKMDAAEGAGQPNGIDDVLTDAVERENWENGEEIDWHDVLLRTGKITDAGISLSGGSDKITFYLNGNAYLEDGIVQHTSFNRYSFRLNTEYNPYKFIKVGARIQLSRTMADETGNAAVWYQNRSDFTDFLGNTPLGRMYNENNELVPTVKGDQFDYNPLWKYRESETTRSTNRFLLNPYIELTIMEGLTYRINALAEIRNEKYGRFTSSKYNWSTLEDEPGRNYSTITVNSPNNYVLDNIVNYKKTFAEKHSFDATLIYGLQYYTFDSLGVEGEGSNTDLLSFNAINSSLQDYKNINWLTDDWSNLYFAGRLGYNYDRRYVFTFTGRYDGSSVFGPEKRWGFFPSTSFAWNVSEESFMENLAFLDVLKYRISWGRMGNDQIGTFGYIALTQNVSYPYSGSLYSGYTADKLPNSVLQWETSQQFNTGIDFAFLGNSIYGSVDFYRTNTIDLILDEQVPSVTGFESIVSNVGETMNQGVEAIISYRLKSGDFQWEITANWARDRNEIVHLSGEVDEEGNEVDNLANGWFIGQDINEIYDFDFVGIYQLGEEAQAAAMHPDIRDYGAGDPKIRDVNGDGVINFEDETFLGNPTPDWYGGVNNTFSWRGIELSILFEAVQGVTRINYFYGGLTGRGNEIKVDYWTPTNPSNEFPQPNIRSPYNYQDAVRVRDASFVALRNVSLSYNLPREIIQRVKLTDLQVYVRGNNLMYFTDYKDAYSPETDLGRFPITKNWTIGTNITF